MNAGIELLFWILFGSAITVTWAIWECCQFARKRRERKVICESRYFQHGREIGSRHDCWEIEGKRVR